MQSTVTEDREKYLGGSDISAVMELSPFTKRFDLLRYKAGVLENDFDGNSATEYGNVMEGKIRDYINTTGYDFQEDKIVVENETGVIGYRYHADGSDHDKGVLLEIKTTSQIHDKLSDYKMYLVQLIYGMMLFDYADGILAVYERPEDMDEEFDESRLQVFNIKFEDYHDLMDEIKQGIDSFQKDLAYLKENYLASEDELPSRKALSEYTQKTISVGDRELPILYLLENEKSLTDAIKGIKDELCKQMEEHHIRSTEIVGNAKTRVTFVPQGEDKQVEKFDETAFKKAEPEMYKKYLTEKTQKGKKAYVLIKH